MPQLIDQFGNPISSADIAALAFEQATPTLAGVRPPWSAHPAEFITPWRMAEIHRAAALGYSLPYMELAEDIEERDLHYAGVLSTRKRQVTQLPLTVQAASDDPQHMAHAAFIETWLKSEALDRALFDMLDAVGKGYSVMEIDWDTTPGAIVPRKLIYRPQRWFEVAREDGETIMLRVSDGFEPLNPWKFVVHRHPSKSGLVLRSGIARIASWAWMFKTFTLRDWASFCQNYGMPVRLGRYGPEASPHDKQILWTAVSNIAGDCAAIIPKSMEMDFVEVGNTQAGSELYLKRADWLDQQISKAVLGQTTTTDAVRGGHAVSREHRQVQEDIEKSDAKMLATTISQQLFAPIIAFNFGQQRAYPVARIGRQDEVPVPELVSALQWLGPQGFTVSAQELRDRLGLRAIEGDEAVVGGRPAPVAPVVSPPHVATVDETHGLAQRATEDAEGNGPQPPTQPPPPAQPPAPAQHTRAPVERSLMATLISRHAGGDIDPALIERMTERLGEEAAGALAGLTDQVRHELVAASDLHDLAHRLSRLRLDPDGFARAMQRGMAIAHLAGQASLLDEIHALHARAPST